MDEPSSMRRVPRMYSVIKLWFLKILVKNNEIIKKFNVRFS